MVTAVKITEQQQAKLDQLIAKLPDIIKKLKNPEYDEIFGYRINVSGTQYVDEQIRDEILLKFLIANDYDVSVTVNKLIDTLNWRAEFSPLSAAFNEKFPSELNKLGVITQFPESKDNFSIATWNLYGNMKNPKVLFDKFGDSDSKRPGTVFLRWRVGLMEKSLAFIDYKDPNNHKIVQVHDYNGVSMFKADKGMRASTKEIIKIFGDNCPELLRIKFFLNVPSLMSWVFGFFSSIGIISKETLQKFRPLNNGDLTEWYSKDVLPKAYGGINKLEIFDMDQSAKASIPEYGKVILEKINKSDIDDINLSVE